MIGENNTIKTKRMQTVSGKESFLSSYYLSGLGCYLERLDWQVSTLLESQNAFTSFKAYIDGSPDIVIGDLVEDLQANQYTVKGVERFENNPDTGDHVKLILVKTFIKND